MDVDTLGTQWTHAAFMADNAARLFGRNDRWTRRLETLAKDRRARYFAALRRAVYGDGNVL